MAESKKRSLLHAPVQWTNKQCQALTDCHTRYLRSAKENRCSVSSSSDGCFELAIH